jgi:transposase
MGEHGILMHDNARPHAASVVREYLNEVGIRRFDWPALSPDMSPIEHVWDELGRRIRRHAPAPRIFLPRS